MLCALGFPNNLKGALDLVSSVLTVLGTIGAAAFFLWKIFTGWLIVNLQVSLDLTRQQDDDKQDLLAIKLTLKKGSTDTLRVNDMSLRIRFEDPQTQPVLVDFDDITRVFVSAGRLSWDADRRKKAKFTLSPDESVQFAKVQRIPKDGFVIVDAAVHGDRAFWSRGFQWRVSAAALPVANDDRKKKAAANCDC